MFCNLLDLAGINARILFTGVTGSKLSRRAFIMQLVDEICAQNIQDAAVPVGAVPTQSLALHKRRQQCQVMLCKGNKTATTCTVCGKRTCGSCTKHIPITCKKC